MDNLLQKMLLLEISKEYCEDNETIQDVVTKFKKYTNEMDKSEDYTTCMSKVSANIETLSNLLCMKKLEHNKNDIYELITLLEKEIENLKIIAKEDK
jgi:hypothetical protein